MKLSMVALLASVTVGAPAFASTYGCKNLTHAGSDIGLSFEDGKKMVSGASIGYPRRLLPIPARKSPFELPPGGDLFEVDDLYSDRDGIEAYYMIIPRTNAAQMNVLVLAVGRGTESRVLFHCSLK